MYSKTLARASARVWYERNVGIRFLLDTYIGGNDGVPFTIPGESELCDTFKDLPAQSSDHKIPDFLQALEKPDLAHPDDNRTRFVHIREPGCSDGKRSR